MQLIPVSTYNGINPKPTGELDYQQALKKIQSGELKNQIEKIRNATDKATQEKIKKKLPGVTFSGVFAHRGNDEISKPSGFVIIDLDSLTPQEITDYKKIFRNDRYCFFYFISPRGEGIKAGYRSDKVENDATHKRFFESVRASLVMRGIDAEKIDNAGKDISRLCFLSYDPDLWRNPDPWLWPEKDIINPHVDDSEPDTPKTDLNKKPDSYYGGDHFQWFDNSGNVIAEKLPCFSDMTTEWKRGPSGNHSEKMLSVLNTLVWSNLSDGQIFDLFEQYAIGEKYREKGKNRRQWLQKQIDKARRDTSNRATPLENRNYFEFKTTPTKEKTIYAGDAEDWKQPELTEKDIYDAAYDGDDGTARLFQKMYSGFFRYDRAADEYYIWNKHFWETDALGDALRAVAGVAGVVDGLLIKMRKTLIEADKIIKTSEDPEAIKKAKKEHGQISGKIKVIYGLSKKLKTLSGKRNALTLAGAGYDSIGMAGDEWDHNKNLLAFNNGVLELDTMNFRPGRRADLIKSFIPHDFNGLDSVSTVWENFLYSIFDGDTELIDFVQRLFGYALAGNVKYHILPILWGRGRNGKGTLVETLAHCFGDSITQKISADALMESRSGMKGNHDADTLSLMGKRICWGSETAQTKRLNAAKVKELVGGDTLTGRWPYGKRNVTFRPVHTLFLLTNHKPVVPADDIALWERLILIPFEKQFLKDNPETDPGLPEKLKSETAGIIAWSIRGLIKYQKKGLFPLPEKVRAAVDEYQNESDKIGEFIDEGCKINDLEQVGAASLYNVYKKWIERRSERAMTQTAFGLALKNKGFEKKKTNNGVVYIGITYREDIQHPHDERYVFDGYSDTPN